MYLPNMVQISFEMRFAPISPEIGDPNTVQIPFEIGFALIWIQTCPLFVLTLNWNSEKIDGRLIRGTSTFDNDEGVMINFFARGNSMDYLRIFS